MKKEFKCNKDSLIIFLSGEIDQYAASNLKSKIDVEIEHSGKKNLIFDLTDVSLMDSSGIGLIVGRYKLINTFGGKLAVCGASGSISKMLELSGLRKIIEQYDNLESAEKHLSLNRK